MSCLNDDAAELPQASYWPDMAAIIDGDNGEIDQLRRQIERRAAQVANHVICSILGYGNPELALIAYAIAHNVGGLGENSIETYAKQLGVTRQAISKLVTHFRDIYKLETLGGLKTNQARQSYQKAQLKRNNIDGNTILNRERLYRKHCSAAK